MESRVIDQEPSKSIAIANGIAGARRCCHGREKARGVVEAGIPAVNI